MWKRFKRFGLFLDTGTGKTATALTVLRESRPFPALVLCPLTIVGPAWLRDAEVFAPDLRMVSAAGGKKKRYAALQAIERGEADVLVVNYEAMRADVHAFLLQHWKCVIMDESTRAMNPRSKTALACHKLCNSPGVEWVTVMSGCPRPNSPLELWSQIHCVDPGALEPTYWAHRASRAYQPNPRSAAWLWVIRPGEEDRLAEDVGRVSRFLRKEECLDLPEVTHEVREVELGREEKRVYKEFLANWIVRLDEGEVIGQSALAELMKLRQFTAGIVKTRQGTWADVGDTKLKALLELMQDIGRDPHGRSKPVVIVGEFRRELERSHEALQDSGRRGGILYGGVPQGERGALVQGFQGGALEYLCVHPAAAGHGLTLTASSDMIFLSHGYSYENYYQVMQRIHRIGQEQPCTYYHLMAKDTIDQDVLGVLEKKQSADQEFVRRFRERV
jgi:SNF2 family DNA or RNA helicase